MAKPWLDYIHYSSFLKKMMLSVVPNKSHLLSVVFLDVILGAVCK